MKHDIYIYILPHQQQLSDLFSEVVSFTPTCSARGRGKIIWFQQQAIEGPPTTP